MSLQTVYREWNMDDTAATQKVLLNTWIASYADFIPMKDIQWYFNNYYSDINFARLHDDPNIWSFVAEVKGHVVGYARGKINQEQNRFYLESLYVLPEFQGKGIGMELLKMVELKAKELQYLEIWLGVMVQNIPSLEWYKKLGFQFVEESPFQMGKTTVNHLIGFRVIR
ncbi:MAG: GNAT family N-acetyltransferase [Ignavibacteriales bacterium]|nr:GNAT family N-acetyltransferase [Ignavibacteriales bacterium]